MSGPASRLVVAGAVTTMLLGIVVNGAALDLGTAAEGRTPQLPAVVADPTPIGAAAAVARARTGLESQLVSLAESAGNRLGALALALVLGLAPVAARQSCLRPPDRSTARPLRRSTLAALRAPPARGLV